MIPVESDFTLRNARDGKLATPEAVERVCDQLMVALLDIEAVTNGHVHSAAVSAVADHSQIQIEFSVDVPTVEEASLVARTTVQSAIADTGLLLEVDAINTRLLITA